MSALSKNTPVKNFWNEQPCNIKHSNKPIGSKEYFNEVEKRKYFVESHIPVFANFAEYKNKKVLEIGCGIGTDAISFARHGADYTGVELSNRTLDITKKRFEVFNLKGKFFNIDAQDYDSLLLAGNEFDLIYSFGVIHHSEDPQQIIDNCYKLLKQGGTLKIMLYAENSWKKIMIDSSLDQYEAQSGCPVAFTYTHQQVYELLKKYKNINIEQSHIFPYKVSLYKQYIYEKEEWFKHMPDKIFNALEKSLGWHLCITAQKLD